MVSRQVLKGWRRVCPHGGCLPQAMVVVAMLLTQILSLGRPDIAIMVVLMLETYCRLSELLFFLQARDMIPGDRRRGAVRATAILLHPFERGRPAKNQE